MTATWEARVADLWKIIDDCQPEAFVAQMDALVAELPPDNAIGLFERGAAQAPWSTWGASAKGWH